MSTELTQDKQVMNLPIPQNSQQVESAAKLVFESGLFPDLKSYAQAYMKVQAGAEIGIGPFASIGGIHVIQGKPMIGGPMLAKLIKRTGRYNYRVTEHTDKVCTIEIYEKWMNDGQWTLVGTSSFNQEDARKMSTKNMDKMPRNMLFARAISNAARWYCPDVVGATVYVDGELSEAHTIDTTAEPVTPPSEITQDQLDEFNELLLSDAFTKEQKANTWNIINANGYTQDKAVKLLELARKKVSDFNQANENTNG
jgi:hypothetical protein